MFFGDLLDLPILYEIGLWFVAVASTITVLQRILLVRRQAVARAADTESASAPDQT